jgi:hypothetical protein
MELPTHGVAQWLVSFSLLLRSAVVRVLIRDGVNEGRVYQQEDRRMGMPMFE